MEVAIRNLVQHVEVYRPDADDECVHPAGEGHAFHRGEGAVGAAWESGVPAIDRGDGGSVAVAIPSFQSDECRGIVALYCEESEGVNGAVELWRKNERGELGLAEQWYAGLERLQRISQFIKFPRRAGLPGRVWDDRFPRVLGALQDSKSFIRVAAARSEQLASAVGVPFMRRPPELEAVLLLLNTKGTPMARAMEVWARDLETGQLKIVSADYGDCSVLATTSRTLSLRKGDGVAGRVFQENAPFATRDLLGVEFPRGDRFGEYGFEWGVGMPVYIGADLVASVNLYL